MPDETKQLLTWSVQFETGDESVDHEHREMIELLNRLYERLQQPDADDTVAAFLGEVFANISAHFALEESIMRGARYDGYAAHKEDHEELLDEIRDIMDMHESGAFDDAAELLAERLRRWFEVHFQTHDSRLARVLGH